MKRFLIQIVVFTGCLSIFIMIILYTADGHADGLYLKFTTPKQSSMIIGTSKATQGLQPVVMNEVLGRNDIYNYSFTVVHSPYGPAYLESIKKKLDKSTKNGIFIITVDPHSISSKGENPNDPLSFRENESAVGKIDNVNTFPNFEYLLYHYPRQPIYLLTRKLSYVNEGFLHDDGWVETNLSLDPKTVEQRTAKKMKSYFRQSQEYNFSKVRLDYLERTISYLKNFGEVYMVRLPVIEALLELENSIIPDFDQRMENIANKYNLPYLNLTSKAEEYTYEDGNHLDENSGKIVSKEIAEWIKTSQK